MEFDVKLKAALERLSKTDIWRSSYAPPLYRLLWRLGVPLPPPHFSSFGFNFVLSAISFSVAWGLLMWFPIWSGQGIPVGSAIFSAAFAGSLFGLVIAFYYRRSARSRRLPSWSEFKG